MKAQDTPTSLYAPIVRSCWTSVRRREWNTHFEMCYVLAREGLAFLKYPLFDALAERQGVELGTSYKIADSAKFFTQLSTFTTYIKHACVDSYKVHTGYHFYG